MRNIAILALMGISVAAGEPKTPPQLNTTERIALRALLTESEALQAQQKDLSERFAAFKRETCRRTVQADACDISREGMVSPAPAPVKPEVQK